MIEVDARGLSCPEPVLLTMDALDEANRQEPVLAIVSDSYQRDNIKRVAARRKMTVEVEQKGQDFYLTIQ